MANQAAGGKSVTTVENLSFRHTRKQLGADMTCGEVVACTDLLPPAPPRLGRPPGGGRRSHGPGAPPRKHPRSIVVPMVFAKCLSLALSSLRNQPYAQSICIWYRDVKDP